MRTELNRYDWSTVDVPLDIVFTDIDAFTTVVVPSTYSDICKQEQIMSDTLQQTRLVALVTARADNPAEHPQVLRYHLCTPNPHSPHRMR